MLQAVMIQRGMKNRPRKRKTINEIWRFTEDGGPVSQCFLGDVKVKIVKNLSVFLGIPRIELPSLKLNLRVNLTLFAV